MSLLLLPLYSPCSPALERDFDSSPEVGDCVGAPQKVMVKKSPLYLLPWFREGNSLFPSHPVHQHPWGQGDRGNFIPGVVPRHSPSRDTSPAPFLHP